MRSASVARPVAFLGALTVRGLVNERGMTHSLYTKLLGAKAPVPLGTDWCQLLAGVFAIFLFFILIFVICHYRVARWGRRA